DLLARLRTTRPGDGAIAGEVVEPAEGHLRPACVVDAEEQHGGHVVERGHGGSPQAASGWSWGTTRSRAGRPGNRNRARPTAARPPTTWATMNPGADDGWMPANVSLRVRPMVTAGLAKLVDDVNQ